MFETKFSLSACLYVGLWLDFEQSMNILLGIELHSAWHTMTKWLPGVFTKHVTQSQLNLHLHLL